ncbi:hypothetical protein A8C56_02165 [Niabella ginsenosidivorans]|uniref:Lipoprotein n=1 Tax=Niabella ginsenosidivorans TaxID=1176587 RepID=A0A1A9HYS1_9BACT|nr:hypothetical protein [Niabella ginsenosidivorans]ANH79939.1 hypothetical protein A8C56_02165 [Niabella ginsenosidivorans]
MIIRIFVVSLGLLLLTACKNPEAKKPEVPADSTVNADTSNPVAAPPENKDTSTVADIHSNNDSVIYLNASGRLSDLTVDIKKDYQRVYISVPVNDTKKLNAVLKPEGKNRNVRFNQIELPDKKTDGPFGLSVAYSTKKNGTYGLIIGRNNMAEGTVKGPVNVHIVLE